eukprot:scaffold264605_cov26-Tisochrysis_lutea.AAC.1
MFKLSLLAFDVDRRNSCTCVGAARCTRGTPRSPADSKTFLLTGRALKAFIEAIISSSSSSRDLGLGARPARAAEASSMSMGTVGVHGALAVGEGCGFSFLPSERKREGVLENSATFSASVEARSPLGDAVGELGAEREVPWKWNSCGIVS